jgi:hypothetical protein
MDFTLNSEERELLLEVLEERQREMLREISRTRHHEFRNSLRKNEHILENVIIQLRSLHPNDFVDRVA